jgi:putative ABC transport system permease protein
MMGALITLVIGTIRQRRVQFIIITLIVLLCSGIGTMALILFQNGNSLYEKAFDKTQGPHLSMSIKGSLASKEQIQATTRLPEVTASNGPWQTIESGINYQNGKDTLHIIGRPNPDGPVNQLTIAAGRWLEKTNEIVLTRSLATSRHIAIGDQVQVLNRFDAPILTVVGEAVDISIPDVTMWYPQNAWVLPETISQLLPTETTVPDWKIVYRFAHADTEAEMKHNIDAITAALPEKSLIGAQSHLLIGMTFNVPIETVSIFLSIFACIAIGVAVLLIINIIAGAVLASYRDIGIIRALGFTPNQTSGIFVIQMLLPAFLGCIIGSPIGLIATLPILNQNAEALAIPTSNTLDWGTALIAICIVLGITTIAAFMPARRAAKLNPIVALNLATVPPSRSPARIIKFLQYLNLPQPMILGINDAFVRPARAMSTTIAILIGIVTLIFSIGNTQALERLFSNPNLGGTQDIVIQRNGEYPDAKVMESLQSSPETDYIIAESQVFISISGTNNLILGIPHRGNSIGLQYLVTQGRWFNGPGEVVVGEQALQKSHLHIGDRATFEQNEFSFVATIVGTTFEFANFGQTVHFDWNDYQKLAPGAAPQQYLVTLKDGSNKQAYADAITAIAPQFLSVSIDVVAPGKTYGRVMILSMTILAIILLTISAIGVFNTILLNTREQTKDIALLKSIGMTPLQTIWMIISSASTIGLIGSILGIPFGIWLFNVFYDHSVEAFGEGIPTSIYHNIFNPIQFPAIILVGIAIAILGALIPAWITARQHVIDALRAE